MSRAHDLVLWGATGFTGRFLAEHLARDYSSPKPAAAPRRVRWALAGRNRAKLEALRGELATMVGEPSIKDVPILVASLDDPASLDAAIGSAAVVLTTAGPYTELGTPLLEAAVRNGTHYADLTAEIPWMRKMMAAHADTAAANGVKVVHAAGFDSQPTDLLAYLATDACRAATGAPPSRVYTLAGDAKGGFSGGTVHSLIAAMYDPPPKERAAAFHPYSLCVGLAPPTPPPEGDPWTPRWVAPASTWAAPFIMAFINARVARRSAALRPDFYGKAYAHTEVMAVPGRVAAFAVALASAAIGAVLALPPARWALARAVPRGSGPSIEMCKTGYWSMDAVAVASVADPTTGARRVFRARGGDKHRDPGYWGTARMLLELGLAMALDGDACEAAGCLKGGFLTPATAGGPALVDRLRRAGLTFEVLPEGKATVVE